MVISIVIFCSPTRHSECKNTEHSVYMDKERNNACLGSSLSPRKCNLSFLFNLFFNRKTIPHIYQIHFLLAPRYCTRAALGGPLHLWMPDCRLEIQSYLNKNSGFLHWTIFTAATVLFPHQVEMYISFCFRSQQCFTSLCIIL